MVSAMFAYFVEQANCKFVTKKKREALVLDNHPHHLFAIQNKRVRDVRLKFDSGHNCKHI